MRRSVLVFTFALAALALFSMDAAGQGMRLFGDAYMSNGTAINGFDDVWVGIYIDMDGGGYDSFELYDTENTEERISAVTWDGTNGTYELLLDDTDPGWQRGNDYIIVINATDWGDTNGTVHELFSTAVEWTIPTDGGVHENEIDVQTRFTGFVINELVFNDQAETDEDEWIEIYNPTSLTRSIDNWIIHDNDTGGARFGFGNLPDFPAGSFIVVHWKTGTNETAFGQSQEDALHVYTNTANKWNNGEDQVCLYDSYRIIVDFVAYCADGDFNDLDGDDYGAVQAGIWTEDDFVPFGAGGGASIGLEYDGIDHDSSGDWIVFTTPSQGESNVEGTPVPELGLVAGAIAAAVLMFLARRTRAERR